jgi:hypothetical protein
MASPAQIEANRRNAQMSTGPRSGEGKAAARLNALKHGADARSPVLPGEDPAALEALTVEYRRHYHPAGPEETFLVETLIQADWNRRRYARIETELANRLLAEIEPCDFPLGALFAADSPGSRMLDRVIRHREAAERAWFRAYKELQRLQAESGSGDLLPEAVPETPRNWVRSDAATPVSTLPAGRTSPAAGSTRSGSARDCDGPAA